MAKNPVIKFNGLVNKYRPEELPLDKLFKAVNVMFTDRGELVMPGQEFATVYAGVCHSINVSSVGKLFAEGGTLKRYNDNPTPTALLASVGSNAFSYTRPINNTVYFSNGTVTGRFVKGESATREWGTKRPTAEPTATPINTGGMYAGDYRIVTTWVAGEESGAGNSVVVTVPEDGGIRLTAFPNTVPAYATKIAVWCSTCNGKELYLYGEYATNTSEVVISKFVGSIPLETQFGSPPAPAVGAPMVDHYGRIYYGDGAYLRYTHIGQNGPRYGLTMPGNYFPVDGTDVQTAVSCPGVLYVGTLNGVYSIRNIDGDGAPQLEMLLDCAAVKGSECYDPDGKSAYFMTHRGFVRATSAQLEELSFDQVAMPAYASGTMTATLLDGLRYLVFFGQDGTKNDLADADWNTDDWGAATSQDSGWAINLNTKAVSKYEDVGINRVHNGFCSSGSGLGEFGTGSIAVGLAKSGAYDFGESLQKRIPKAYLEINGKALTFSAISDNSDVDYTTDSTTRRETVVIAPMARGAKGRYWQFALTNKTGNRAIVSEIQPTIIIIPRHR